MENHPEIDVLRRRLLAAGATGTAAGLAGWSPGAIAQGKPLPPFASFKDADKMIVHSASGIETRREAFPTSGVMPTDTLFVRNNLGAPDASITANPDAWTIEIDGVTSPKKLSVGELKRMGLASVACVLQCSGNGRGFFGHKASGSQWKVGAAGNALWSGVPVKVVVNELGGVRQGMRYMTSTGGETMPPGVDARGQVLAAPLHDEARGGRIVADQADRGPRHSEPQLDLGTHADPLDERTERVDEERVALVATVVAHLVAQQAARDPDAGTATFVGHKWILRARPNRTQNTNQERSTVNHERLPVISMLEGIDPRR